MFRRLMFKRSMFIRPMVPGGDNHFAQTDADSVIVEISGYGPTDTHYFEAKNDPKSGQSK